MESVIIGLKNNFCDVFLLTNCVEGELHVALRKHGVKCYAFGVNRHHYFKVFLNIIYLVRFCWRHDIDLVQSHLQDSNIIAVFSQFFCRSSFYIFRHHYNYQQDTDNREIRNRNEVVGEKIINRLSNTLIVPSKGVLESILKNEKIHPSKIKIIPYIYDFSRYDKPNPEEVDRIKEKYPARLRLLMVSRFIKAKRHAMVFNLIKDLVYEGYKDLILIAMDEGPEQSKLKEFVIQNNLEDYIVMPGFQNNIIDYMSASDMLLHPSLYDASNSVVKEVGLLEKPVVVVKGIGDFEDYIEHNVNGFLISQNNSYEEMKSIIIQAYQNKGELKNIGLHLKEKILDEFSMNADNLKPYLELT